MPTLSERLRLLEKRVSRIEEYLGIGSLEKPSAHASARVSKHDKSGFVGEKVSVEHSVSKSVEKPVLNFVSKSSKKKVVKSSSVSEVSVEKSVFKFVAVLGVLVVFMAGWWFYSYAKRVGWLTPGGEIVLGIFVGLILLVFGEFLFRKSFFNTSVFFSSAGFSLLYLVFFVMYFIKEYKAVLNVGFYTDVFLLSFVVLGSAALSVLKNSKFLGVYSFSTGYLTAFLGVYADSYILGLTYALILTLGVLFLMYKKGWSYGYFPFVPVYLIYFYFFNSADVLKGVRSKVLTDWIPVNPGLILIALLFLFLFYFIFNAMFFFIKDSKSSTLFFVFLNSLIAFLFTVSVSNKFYSSFNGLVAILFMLFSAGFAALAHARSFSFLFNLFFTNTVFFSALAVPLQLGRSWNTFGWALESVLLFVIGFRFNNKLWRIFSLVFNYLAIFNFFFFDLSLLGWMGALFSLVSLIFFQIVLQRLVDVSEEFVGKSKVAFDVSVVLTAFVFVVYVFSNSVLNRGSLVRWLAVKLQASLPALSLFFFVFVVSLSGVLLAYFYSNSRRKVLPFVSVGFWSVSFLFFFFGTLIFANFPGSSSNFSTQMFFSIFFSLALLLWVFYNYYASSVFGSTLRVFLGAGFLSVLTLGVPELIMFSTLLFASVSMSVRLAVFSVFWALESLFLINYGLKRRVVSLRVFGIVLLFITILKVFVFDLSGTFARVVGGFFVGVLAILAYYLYERVSERYESNDKKEDGGDKG